jgi:predicted O-linked N-acetylglucosamine transferase (SPINDLY family)
MENVLDDAFSRFGRGDLEGAMAACREALTAFPGDAEALHLLGLCLLQSGETAEAVSRLRRSVLLAPANAAGWLNLGVALRRLGRAEEAEESIQEALRRDPDFAGAWFNLGNLCLDAGRFAEAEAAYRRALAAAPDDPRPLQNLGVALKERGSLAEAEAVLRRAVAAQPGNAGALNNLGNVLRELKRAAEAVPILERAAGIDALSADIAYNLGAALADEDRMEEAGQAFAVAVSRRPTFTKARWAAALSLPVLYDADGDIEAWRDRYAKGLAEMADLSLATPSEVAEALSAIRERTNFALPYQGRNDRQLQEQYGALVHRIAMAAHPQYREPPRPPARARRRIGFVSAHFRHHTVLKLFAGWMTGLDRTAFEVHAFATAPGGDAATEALRSCLDGYHGAEPETIAAAACDALIHLDIGMDPRAQVLAALRLAPRQYVAWGHPETTGLPTIDGFLSSDLMEPPDGANHYSEPLIRLPNLSIAYARPPAPPPEARTNGPPRLLCSQSLFKLLPAFDRLAARVAREVGRGTVEFIAHPSEAVTRRFRRRIGAAFRAAGVDEDRIVVHPRLDPAAFLALNGRADVLLDSLGWSGGNTTLEALALGLPVVTLPGALMRGRHSAAILERAGRRDLIANDEDDYVAIAARLAEGRERVDVPDGLYDDPIPIRALENFLR